jgi:hypothetical protein
MPLQPSPPRTASLASGPLIAARDQGRNLEVHHDLGSSISTLILPSVLSFDDFKDAFKDARDKDAE